MTNTSETTSGSTSSASEIPNPARTGTETSNTNTTRPTETQSNTERNESNENLRDRDPNTLDINELNQRLNSVEGDIAAHYRELISIYQASQGTNPTIRLDAAAKIQLETHVKNYADQFELAISGVTGSSPQEVARRNEYTQLQDHARNTVEVMMNQRNAGFREYMALTGDDFSDRIQDLLRNPMDMDKWMDVIASASIMLRYFGIMEKASYRNLAVTSQADRNNENTTENTPESTTNNGPETVDLRQIVGAEYTTNGITAGGYRVDAQGNAFRGDSPVAMAALPENIKHLSKFMKDNFTRLRYVNYQVDTKMPEHSHYKMAFIALRIGQTEKFRGKDPITFLENYHGKMIQDFMGTWGFSTAGRRGVENGMSIFSAMDHGLDEAWAVVGDYGVRTPIRHEILNTIAENPDRLVRWINEINVDQLMNGKTPRQVPEAEQGWAVAPVPTWTAGGSTLAFEGGYSMDVTGNVTLNDSLVPDSTELPPGMKEIREFAKNNQSKLNRFAEKIDSGNAQNVGEVRMPALLCALRLQMHLKMKGRNENAFDYLMEHWGSSEGIGDSKIYGEYSEGVGESLAEVATITGGTAAAGAGIGALLGTPLGPGAVATSGIGALGGLIVGGVVGAVSAINESIELIDDMISFEETINKEILAEKMVEDNYEILFAYVDQH